MAGIEDRLAVELGCGFSDTSMVASPLPIDGVHLDAENTASIRHAPAPNIRDLLGN